MHATEELERRGSLESDIIVLNVMVSKECRLPFAGDRQPNASPTVVDSEVDKM